MEEFDFINSKIPSGLSVIEASAGTGKTYSISHLVARMILDGSVSSIRDILLVTFTNDAAGELAERTRRVLEELNGTPATDEHKKSPGIHALRTDPVLNFDANRHRIYEALRDIDLLCVSTIHSFCQSVLKTEGPLCGVPSIPELIPDADDLIDEAVHDEWVRHIASNPIATASLQAAKVDFAKHRGFLKRVLPMDIVEALPQPRAFTEMMLEIDSYRGKFTGRVCDELRDILSGDNVRKDSAPPLEVIIGYIDSLRDAPSASVHAFLQVCSIIKDAPEWLSARSSLQKEIKARALGLDAVRFCADVDRLVKHIGWAWLNESSSRIKGTIEQTLHRNRLITYDGLVSTLHKALFHPDTGDKLADQIRARHKVALIDESQDTDSRQFEIFSRIFAGSEQHSLVLIGDPKQSIYAFRGADVNTYLRAKTESNAVFSLTKTFRAPQRLVDAVNALFELPRSLLKEGLEFKPASSGKTADTFLQLEGDDPRHRLEVWIAPDATGEYDDKRKRLGRISESVASEIVRILNSDANIVTSDIAKPVAPSDLAVLVSKHEQAEAICIALRKRGVPVIQSGTQDVMASEEAADILAILKAVNEPRKLPLRNAALTTRMMGRTDADLMHLECDDAEQARIDDAFLTWQALWQSQGVVALLSRIDADGLITRNLGMAKEGERRITNFRHLVEILAATQAETSGKPNELIRWLSQDIRRARNSRADLEERQLRLESDDDAVKVVTMHAAKGLEYNLVFCPFLWDAKEPAGIQKLNRPVPSRSAIVEIELVEDASVRTAIVRADLEDRLRLAYVAITRAKVKAWIYAGEICGSRKRTDASALDWIFRTDQNPQDFSAWRILAKSAGRGARHASGLGRITGVENVSGVIIHKEPPEPSAEIANLKSRIAEISFDPEPAPPVPKTFWRVTSFSQLTREKNAKGESAKPSEEEGSSRRELPLNAFARLRGGAELGTAVHDFLESWDFASVPTADFLTKHFSAYSLGADKDHVPPAVAEMLAHLRKASLLGMACSIEEACQSPETSEWQFHLPAKQGFSVSKIAAVFRKHGDPDYAESLESLGSDSLEGFLQGFIDKIATHAMAYGVIDWKTNQLAAYDQQSLREAARSSHYWLQTHLYLVSLCRYLGPQAATRGAWLVYLRGVQSGTSNSILHIEPTPELLQGLDELFTRPTP
jgi:exodeoxyribonuclease V beta subunit